MELHVSLVGRRDLSGEIYRQLRQAILDGRLRHGDLLPPSRELARSLSVSRTTVTVAYDRLWGEGLATARVGAGTFVSAQLLENAAEGKRRRAISALRPRPIWDAIGPPTAFSLPAQFDFRTGLPDVSLFPYQTWRRLLAGQLHAEAVGTGVYADSAGHRGLREAIVRHIGASRGVQASPDDVVITNGTQQALDLIARVLLAPGERLAIEDPCYEPPRRLFETLGLRVQGVPVDRQGLVVDALPRNTRLVYTTPSHQYPLGMTMSLQRRLALLAWAEQHNAAIIEDDYDSEFRFGGRPLEPLQTLDTSGRVIYVGSFSKTLLPTLRLGFVIAPPSLRDAMQRAKYVMDWHTSLPLQMVLASFIDDGGFARHLRKMRPIYQARHELLTSVLARDFAGRLEVIPSDAGLHITALAHAASLDQMDAVLSRALTARVVVHRLSVFAFDQPAQPGLVLGYGAIPTDQIEEGLGRLRACFDG
ncbi:MAG: PLP-dependent aminotransferase family protein [Chloroflexi bacterium]|nr:PLP-dependent aminotransferase family protein [Chloroflexota bacterium]